MFHCNLLVFFMKFLGFINNVISHFRMEHFYPKQAKRCHNWISVLDKELLEPMEGSPWHCHPSPRRSLWFNMEIYPGDLSYLHWSWLDHVLLLPQRPIGARQTSAAGNWKSPEGPHMGHRAGHAMEDGSASHGRLKWCPWAKTGLHWWSLFHQAAGLGPLPLHHDAPRCLPLGHRFAG